MTKIESMWDFLYSLPYKELIFTNLQCGGTELYF